jgi:hypothetical protein
MKFNNIRVFTEFSGHKAISPDIIFEKNFSSSRGIFKNRGRLLLTGG